MKNLTSIDWLIGEADKLKIFKNVSPISLSQLDELIEQARQIQNKNDELLKLYRNFLILNVDSISINANDFFAWASCDSVEVENADLIWLIPHIEKWGFDGLFSGLAYIVNTMPIEPRRNKNFMDSLKELQDAKIKVHTSGGNPKGEIREVEDRCHVCDGKEVWWTKDGVMICGACQFAQFDEQNEELEKKLNKIILLMLAVMVAVMVILVFFKN